MSSLSPLDGAIARAVNDLLDSDRKQPSHSDMDMIVPNSGLEELDPKRMGANLERAAVLVKFEFAAMAGLSSCA